MTFIKAMTYEAENETIYEPKILDSGKRTEFATGAVRDIQEGKGRCDLLPLGVVGELFDHPVPNEPTIRSVFTNIGLFATSGDTKWLIRTLSVFKSLHAWDAPTMVLETAIHFEEGAKKYGENNWRKGIPVQRYIDSALRHYLKWLRGDKDEPHDRAFCWNIMCAIWTCWNKPELNDYANGTEE